MVDAIRRHIGDGKFENGSPGILLLHALAHVQTAIDDLNSYRDLTHDRTNLGTDTLGSICVEIKVKLRNDFPDFAGRMGDTCD